MLRFRVMVAGLLALAGCPDGQSEVPDGAADVQGDVAPEPSTTPADLPPPPEGEGLQMGIDTVAPAGQEIWKCYVTTLPNAESVAINHVKSLQTPFVHHMDIMALGLLPIADEIPEGMHECDTLYETYPAMMEEGIFLYASQTDEAELTLPQGVAATLPGNLKIMVEIHFVNTRPYDVDVWTRVNAYFMPFEELVDGIWGSAVRDANIHIPPGISAPDEHVEWTRCEMNKDVEVLILSSHTHERGRKVDVFTWDGEATGDTIYTNLDWHSPQLLVFDEPLVVKKGQGFEFRCHFDNPFDHEVNWGFQSTDEMCQIGIVHTPADPSAECVIVESSDGWLGD